MRVCYVKASAREKLEHELVKNDVWAFSSSCVRIAEGADVMVARGHRIY
jgi:hypothetical protein